MRYEQAVKDFERIHVELYINKVDYWTGQLAWATYVDELCKDGIITQKQYDTWETPFPYGEHLKPNYKQLAMAYDR